MLVGGTGPFRVTVVTGANQCILLDNVPYNEDNTMATRNYTITVMIPDFECRAQQRCALVVENISELIKIKYIVCMCSPGTGNRSSAPISIRYVTKQRL